MMTRPARPGARAAGNRWRKPEKGTARRPGQKCRKPARATGQSGHQLSREAATLPPPGSVAITHRDCSATCDRAHPRPIGVAAPIPGRWATALLNGMFCASISGRPSAADQPGQPPAHPFRVVPQATCLCRVPGAIGAGSTSLGRGLVLLHHARRDPPAAANRDAVLLGPGPDVAAALTAHRGACGPARLSPAGPCGRARRRAPAAYGRRRRSSCSGRSHTPRRRRRTARSDRLGRLARIGEAAAAPIEGRYASLDLAVEWV
jgi:hypothetical protein